MSNDEGEDEIQTSYTRAQLAGAVDTAHTALHKWESQAGPGHPLREAITEAHEALHGVGAGLPRVGCAPLDPEIQAISIQFLQKLKQELPCGHTLGDLCSAPGTVTFCGACAETIRGQRPAKRYEITGRLHYETAEGPARLVRTDGAAFVFDDLLGALQPEEGFEIEEGEEVSIVMRRAPSKKPVISMQVVQLGTCPRCGPEVASPLVALVSADGSSWDADACERCRCTWWHNPAPKLPGDIPAGAARSITERFDADTERRRSSIEEAVLASLPADGSPKQWAPTIRAEVASGCLRWEGAPPYEAQREQPVIEMLRKLRDAGRVTVSVDGWRRALAPASEAVS